MSSVLDEIIEAIEWLRMGGTTFPKEQIAIKVTPDVWREIVIAAGPASGGYAESKLGPIKITDQPFARWIGPWSVDRDAYIAPARFVIGRLRFSPIHIGYDRRRPSPKPSPVGDGTQG